MQTLEKPNLPQKRHTLCNLFSCTIFESDDSDTNFESPVIFNWKKLDKKQSLLLQSLVTEQMNHNFQSNSALQNLDTPNSHHFKFFLNTLEMFSHSIGVIKFEKYAYRVKNYGVYENLLNQIPRTLDNGSFINFQTYTASLDNEISRFMKKKLENMIKQSSHDENFVQLYKEYSFEAAQYHLILRKIFKELIKFGTILKRAAEYCRKKKLSLEDFLYVEGMIHPEDNQPFSSDIKLLLESFDFTIRKFEEIRIFSMIKIGDLFLREYNEFSPNFDIKSEEISRIYPLSGLTSIASTQNKPFSDEINNQNKSESAISNKSYIELKRKLKLNESLFEKNSQTELDIEREKSIHTRIHSQNIDKIKIMSEKPSRKASLKRFSCVTPNLKSVDNTENQKFGTDVSNRWLNQSNKIPESTPTLKIDKQTQPKSSNLKSTIHWGSTENKENECVLFRRKDPGLQRSDESQLKSLFQENKFVQGKLNNPSILLKFR